ncbi:hypothetical protein CP03DC29_1300, partial [Chlamydia psittaci 03DC29]
ILPFSP